MAIVRGIYASSCRTMSLPSKRKGAQVLDSNIIKDLNARRRLQQPFKGYLLVGAATVYNTASFALIDGASYTILVYYMLQSLAASIIGVYTLYKMYGWFVDKRNGELLWVFLMILAAFDFKSFAHFLNTSFDRLFNLILS